MLPKNIQILSVSGSATISGSIVSLIPVILLWVILPENSHGPVGDEDSNTAIPQSCAEL